MPKKKTKTKKVSVPKEMLDRFEEDAQDNLAHLGNPFTELVIDKNLKKFEAIILREMPVNVCYFIKKEKGIFCWSLGGTMPEESSIKERHPNCRTCPYRDRDCFSIKRVLLFSETKGIIVLSIYKESLEVFNQYLIDLHDFANPKPPTPYFAVKTEISVNRKSKDLQVNFKRKKFISADLYNSLRDYRNSELIETILNSHLLRSEQKLAQNLYETKVKKESAI